MGTIDVLPLAAAALRARKALAARPGWEPLEFQKPPDAGDDWDVWLLLAGRGTGKTRAGAEYVLKHLEEVGERARVGVGAPTRQDAREVCAEGPSGLISIASNLFTYNRSLGEAHHYRGGYVKFMGAEEPDRWNGPQWSLLWADELALWNPLSWDQAQFGLRLGERPRAVVTTTPKARKFVQELAKLQTTVVKRASTADNPYLSPTVRARLYERYGGTRVGRQELDAEWLEDVPGALWSHEMLDGSRMASQPLELGRIVVGVDPSGGEEEGHAEVGIVAAAKGVDGHGYVLRDASARLSPERWARRAVMLYHELKADRIVAERNFGGAMVLGTIRAVDPDVPVTLVNASRSKRIRAEPIAALYEQNRVHHIGVLAALEDQLCSWVPDIGEASPDRLDALVWALSNLLMDDVEVKFY